MRALIAVYDKTGVVDFARELEQLDWEIVSTGGTAKLLDEAGINVHPVETITGQPEILDGRVKTLHPAIHAGILARRDLESHANTLQEHGFQHIDLVACNLYPFKQTVTQENVTTETAIENIDIGGPTMIRAAAKNFSAVSVVIDPEDYPDIISRLKDGTLKSEHRQHLAWKAFQHVASYDSTVAEWLWSIGENTNPPELTTSLNLINTLRYGENPHQNAALYKDETLAAQNAGGIAFAKQHHGKELSYNNYLDADAAWNCVNDFQDSTCVIVKHTNPCGVASRDNLREAYQLAIQGDPVSAFGGIVAFNRPIDEELAREIREFRNPNDGKTRMFYELIIAPEFTEQGLEILKGKSKDLRILEAKPLVKNHKSLRQIGGGWLSQDADSVTPEDIELNIVSKRKPSEKEMDDLKFAWRCVKHIKSNAIVIAKNRQLLGMGSGQPNRVKSLDIAIEKAGKEVSGSALASDAFFPFSWNDAVEHACQSGVNLIAHPGGSLRDQDGIDCCDQYDVGLIFTGIRHFRH